MEDGLAVCLGMLRDSELIGFLEALGKLQLSGMSTGLRMTSRLGRLGGEGSPTRMGAFEEEHVLPFTLLCILLTISSQRRPTSLARTGGCIGAAATHLRVVFHLQD